MEMKPFVRYATHHVWLDTYWLDRHIWDHELIFIEQGSLKIEIEGIEYIAKENDLVVLRPNVHHHISWNNENCSQPHIHFDFMELPDSRSISVSMITKEQMTPYELKLFREDFYKKNEIDIPYILHLKNPVSIKNMIYNIIEEFEHQDPYKSLALQGMMTQLITMVLRENMKNIKLDATSECLNEIIYYMNEMVDKNLQLQDFVEKFNVSQWVLIQNFNKHYGCSPIKYYNKIRLIRAIDLLRYSFHSILEISKKMGFNDPQTFSRWFKNLDGHYPSFYRKSI